MVEVVASFGHAHMGDGAERPTDETRDHFATSSA
jgi:hypothetical protein